MAIHVCRIKKVILDGRHIGHSTRSVTTKHAVNDVETVELVLICESVKVDGDTIEITTAGLEPREE